MSQDKVRLPKEIAAIADSIQNLGDEVFNMPLVLEYIDMKSRRTLDDFLEDARHENWRLWFTALVNGYEVEQTPEDKVREYFENPPPFNNGIGELSTAYRNGVRYTLDALNIKIEGVNA